MEPEAFKYTFKILIVGESGVGKSCILVGFTENRYDDVYVSTIGIDFKTKVVNHKGEKIKLQCWDTAGQERFRTITQSYYHGAHGILLVYDVTDTNSFEKIPDWLDEIHQKAKAGIPIILVGNKNDLTEEKCVSFEYAQKKAKELNLDIIETSAKINDSIESAFVSLIDQMISQKKAEVPANSNVNIFEPNQQKPSLCCNYV